MEETRNHGGRENVAHDRISSLPDEVLTHILSFLSTKEAVHTCVLSKTWKNIWASVPILDIKLEDFSVFGDHDCSAEDDDCSGDCNEAYRMSVARFERFMTGFLDNRAPTNLDRVCCERRNFEVDAPLGWLDRIALLMPQLIDIMIANFSHSLDLPDLVFSCASLQHLSICLLFKVKTIIKPVSINLPCLKFLELTFVELHDDFAQKLFMGCPSLERLELCSCDLYFSGVSSEVLKELTLIDCCSHEPHEQMQISCPALVSLFMIIKRGGISLKNMPSLVNVVIKLNQFRDDVPVLNLFGGLSNVTNLELHLNFFEFKDHLEKDIPNVGNFNNLKKLVVEGTWDMSYDFYLIACLLKHSPNLKELLLLYESQYQIQEPPREVSGDVLFQHEYLEKVKIGHVYGRKLSIKQINAMIKTLGSYVKKIGNMIIA